jgi:hypothetical protein
MRLGLNWTATGLVCLRGQHPHSFIVDPFAVRDDPIALSRRVEPPRHMPGAEVGWRLELSRRGGRTDEVRRSLPSFLRRITLTLPSSPVGMRAGAVVPTTNIGPRGDKNRPPHRFLDAAEE